MKYFKTNNKIAPEILTKAFPLKESNSILRNSTMLQARSIKTFMYGSETVYQKHIIHFTNRIKKILGFLHYSNQKFVNGFQNIVHFVYIKRTYKTLDFCN